MCFALLFLKKFEMLLKKNSLKSGKNLNSSSQMNLHGFLSSWLWQVIP